VLALPNQRWSLDFVHDQLATGRRFRVLNIVDDVTRECLRAVPDTSISGRRVVRELTDLIAERGKPAMIVSDNGTKLTSDAVPVFSDFLYLYRTSSNASSANSSSSVLSLPGTTSETTTSLPQSN
jgi:hypothetical protein